MSPKYATVPSAAAFLGLDGTALVIMLAPTELVVPGGAKASKAAKSRSSNHSVHDVSVTQTNPRGSNKSRNMPGQTRPATLIDFLEDGSGRSVSVWRAAGTLQPNCNAKAAATRGGGSRKTKLQKRQAAVYQPAGGGTTGLVTTQPSSLAA